jgi:hypothetical protein
MTPSGIDPATFRFVALYLNGEINESRLGLKYSVKNFKILLNFKVEHAKELYSAFGKSLCTYKRCWKSIERTMLSKN